MKPDILVVNPHMPHVLAALEEAFTLHNLHGAEDRAERMKELAPKIRGLASTAFSACDRELIDALPNLEIISHLGVGYDTVDVGHALSRNITVTHTPDVLNDEVANTAILLLLSAARRFVEYDRYVRDGLWEKEGNPPLTHGIAGRKIGIVGFGRIGKTIAEKLNAFGCEAVYHGRHEQTDQPNRYYADLAEMARDCYALIVVTPGGAETHHLISREVIEAIGPDGALVNIARGPVVDEKALIACLQDGSLGYAALDVFEDEPHVPESLRKMDNVVLQPHQGSATVETRRAMGDLVVDNLKAFFSGKGPLTPVPEMGR
ncbi:2-hydroxyacid dehydrogenase [Afifella sp. IM 167]|uniref:2-hydroxyacid dehydrogenase n=1 Tax=Afifella sp. IM 167 TaxID=2033586 RepID=UPI001CCBF461|nr:2-hydroxyacid dehydrogenase [Afifella sp. IM 167]MBZ8132105.1 hydroxyacid dehydrogenase [Afifella sp. IM 167]